MDAPTDADMVVTCPTCGDSYMLPNDAAGAQQAARWQARHCSAATND